VVQHQRNAFADQYVDADYPGFARLAIMGDAK
jgi:hypothetical protein